MEEARIMEIGTRDFKLGVAAGILSGILVLPILANLGFLNAVAAVLFVVGMPVAWVIGLFLVRKIAGTRLWMYQAAKFIVTGFLNTALDFGVLNLLSFMTGIYSGVNIIFLNSVSFAVAVSNSYFWNKYWTFGQKGGARVGEFATFVIVAFIGLLVNSGVVFVITTYVPRLDGIDPALLENIAKALATGFSLIWNFVGFKFIVFKA
ncbi:MAG: GtrA family protein [Candidatus Niyogibacteria bacterium]|nr:GtrA family protein [Candidatus Niyogibacteria bacterium]